MMDKNAFSVLPDVDRRVIENKYHKTDEPFDGFNRMAYHGYDFDPSTGKTDSEIDAGLARGGVKIVPVICHTVKAVKRLVGLVVFIFNDSSVGIGQKGKSVFIRHNIPLMPHTAARFRSYMLKSLRFVKGGAKCGRILSLIIL